MSQEKKALLGRISVGMSLLMLIIALGAFLRFSHFPDWLHFELDQARDARVVDDALFGGPGDLTLLGMKAGGTSLRLGPGFYYLQYLSGLLFGPTPVGMATFMPILSVLSIPLFFLFARRYFSERLSLGLTLLFSVSAFLTMYGRFAWNPNPIPFFALLGFYALLRSVEPEARHAGRWFVLAAFAIGFSTHLHFLAFLTLPVVTAAFLLIRRPRFPWKVWTVALAAGLFFYVPVVLNEIDTGGANSKAFIAAVTNKSSQGQHSLAGKLVKDTTEHALGYMVVASGYEGGGFYSFGNTSSQDGSFVTCNSACMRGLKYGILALVIFVSSLVSLGYLIRNEKNRRKSDVLLLSILWFLVPFFVFLPLAYGFAPRFFLVTAPIPFLLLGFLSEAAGKLLPWKRFVILMTAVAIATLACSNLYRLTKRFEQLGRAGTESVRIAPDRILKELTRVTLGQQSTIVAYLKSRSDEHGYPVYMFSEPQHRRALKYLLDRSGVENGVLGFDGIYREGIYVTILRTQSDLSGATKKYLDKYDTIDTREFGTLTLIEFRPKPEAIQDERQIFDTSTTKTTAALPRYTWREWWQRQNDTGNDTADEEDDGN
ncbi:MAG: glycosyltransferase family 39 protein [Candidatus Moraniibacteriota bacterium]